MGPKQKPLTDLISNPKVMCKKRRNDFLSIQDMFFVVMFTRYQV